ncbi:MAG: hypothetical protein JRN34_03525 [Nitrososphaerota archaeon]|nr:hypothetical protein [Nitrososphaerota archaeon]
MGRQARPTLADVEVDICYLKVTQPCVRRGFVVPKKDAWIYAASSTLLTTVCGDCRKYVKLQRKREKRIGKKRSSTRIRN